MKKLLTAIGITLALLLTPVFSGDVQAQVGPVVSSASFLEWDYASGQEGIIQEFRVYLSNTANIIPDGTSFTAQVPYPTLEWAIVGNAGQYYAIVTAVTVVGSIESGPSNEVAYYILDAPVNLGIRSAAAALGMTGGVESTRFGYILD